MNQFFPRKRTRLSLWLRKYRFFCLAAIVFLGSMPVAADQYVASVAAGGVYEEVANVPERRVALVLGTTKWAPSGRVNLFYQLLLLLLPHSAKFTRCSLTSPPAVRHRFFFYRNFFNRN